ncbi:MAG: trans-aconitate 2-methyltransferase [Dehalococcoidia bacterium]|nr:trans-aconitate 2-methyltransferase [Dehalococcoidia bacterium]|tara:strand:- start:10642 stop:11409 length:768 start_codon:yes stop_codon:yes gene_type:complete
MTDWNPTQYLRFGNERLRPAIELIDRINIESPKTIYDLGCGTGSITAILKEKWPRATVAGVDASPNMLEQASQDYPTLTWQYADLNSWEPEIEPDLIYSNAAFQWTPHHQVLLPRLLETIKDGGIFAIQLPKNWREPSHASICEIARETQWKDRLEPHIMENPVAEPLDYYDLLSPFCKSIDMWETTYMQVLTGDYPVLEWTKGTVLPPLLSQLSSSEQKDFIDKYKSTLASSYPKRNDGNTIFPFTRMFIIAYK